MKRFAVLAIALSSLLALGATAANAHRGPGHGRVGASALVTQAAKQLDVTRAKLKASIVGAAEARIDEAVEDGDVDADEAAELKSELDEEDLPGYKGGFGGGGGRGPGR
jgi:hypothetical protein